MAVSQQIITLGGANQDLSQHPGVSRLPVLVKRLGRFFTGWRTPSILLIGLALLSVQTLGLLHGALHAPGLAGALRLEAGPAPGPGQASAHPAFAGESPVDFLAQLFEGHQNRSDCQSFDQLSHSACAVSVPVHMLPLALSLFLAVWVSGAFCARRVALFEARGPPGIR